MKKLAKRFITTILGYQVRSLKKKNDFKVVAVVGSIGKTSTKLAIAQVLSEKFNVRYQEGNYNDLVTVPLVFFNQEIPSLFNPVAWFGVFWRNQKKLYKKYPYDFVVVELGSDGSGQIIEFSKYLKLYISVITAISHEHMEFFDDLDAVAKEETSVSKFSKLIIANADLCSKEYLKDIDGLLTYSLFSKADYTSDQNLLPLDKNTSKPQQYSAVAAAAVADICGMARDEIQVGLKSVKPVAGRMQVLGGINNSIIIDDSYNSSPEAAKLALDTLYNLESIQRIALLGNMNEMGKMSEQVHKDIGNYCDPKKLDLVITIGPDANKYQAPAASERGCKVEMFNDPYAAGEFIKQIIKPGGVVLIKGSQNGVYAEETVKILLKDPSDVSKLVRQSPDWMKIKQQAFNK